MRARAFRPATRACPSVPPRRPCGLTAQPFHPCVLFPSPPRRVRSLPVPAVSESRIKRITQITRITTHRPTAASSFPLRCVLRIPRPITRRNRPLCQSLYIINSQRSVRNPSHRPRACLIAPLIRPCVPHRAAQPPVRADHVPPCLNRGLNGLRGLPHIPTATLSFPAAIRRRDRPLCLSFSQDLSPGPFPTRKGE